MRQSQFGERVKSSDFPSRRATAILAERYRSLFRVTFCHFFPSLSLSLSLSLFLSSPFFSFLASLGFETVGSNVDFVAESRYPRREIKRGSRHCGRRTRRAQSADNYDVQLALITDLFLIRGTGWNIADISFPRRDSSGLFHRSGASDKLTICYSDTLKHPIPFSFFFFFFFFFLFFFPQTQTQSCAAFFFFIFVFYISLSFTLRYAIYHVRFSFVRSRARVLIIWLRLKSVLYCTGSRHVWSVTTGDAVIIRWLKSTWYIRDRRGWRGGIYERNKVPERKRERDERREDGSEKFAF